MAGLTDQGLTIKRLPEILESIKAKQKAKFGNDFNNDTDSVVGIINGIFADEIADLWEAAQGVYDSFYPRSSSGLNLDNVADLNGITRQAETKTSGLLKFTGTPGTIVPQNTLVDISSTKERFSTVSSLTLSTTVFNEITIQVITVVNNTAYSVTIDGVVFTYTSDASATNLEIAAGLVLSINTTGTGITATDNLNGTFKIVVNDLVSNKPITIGIRLSATKVSNLVTAEALNAGPILAPANTVNVLVIPIVGIDSVTNPIDFTLGSDEETDSELRQRRFESVQVAGAGTVKSIQARIRNLPAVSAAFIIENETFSVDADGRPPKSFELIVEGGDEQVIGQTLWDHKPAGIETFGAITRTVFDSVGDSHTVNFSRPDIVYIHVQVDYTKNVEETFPNGGENSIKQQIADFGNSLNIGTDVIVQKFFGPVFTNVQGISTLVIRMATSTDGITPGPFSTANIIIDKKDRALFDISRIAVTEV